jgi:hypothetical protein
VLVAALDESGEEGEGGDLEEAVLILLEVFELKAETVGLDDLVHELGVDREVGLLVPEYERDEAEGFGSEGHEVAEDEELVATTVEGDVELGVAHEEGAGDTVDRLRLEEFLLHGGAGELEDPFEEADAEVRFLDVALGERRLRRLRGCSRSSCE